MRFGSLFSGIGGLDLGLERAGMRCAWQSEIDPYASQVLAKHWPDVPNLGDITAINWGSVEPVDLVCGGFPCQPFSSAARGQNTAADLWPEMLRAIESLRPHWIVGENVTHFVATALEGAMLSLEAIGYEVRAFVIPACAFGHDHRRDRVWICGHTDRYRQPDRALDAEAPGVPRREHKPHDLGTEDGISSRLDVAPRLRALGNAVVPQVAQWIGGVIMNIEAQYGEEK